MSVKKGKFYRDDDDYSIFQVIGVGKDISQKNEMKVAFCKINNADNIEELINGNIELDDDVYFSEVNVFTEMFTEVKFDPTIYNFIQQNLLNQ